jgi:predicted nuclease with TOPRIM domain
LKGNKKSKSEVEYWRGKYKELLSENKRLKKDLKRLKNVDYEFEEFKDAFEDFSEEKVTKRKENLCQNCMRGKLVSVDIPGNRVVRLCKICGNRETKSEDGI